MFLDRVQKISCGRKLNPWLTSLGWISNDVTRINDGHIPGTTKLCQLAEAEGVNLSWLLTGLGNPYLVQHCMTDDSAARHLDALLKGARRVRLVRVLGADGRWHLVVLRPAQGERGEAFVTLVGSLGRLTLDRFRAAADRHVVEEHSPPLVSFLAIGEGLVGRWAMLDPQIGLFAASQQTVPDHAREPSAVFLTAREQLHGAVEAMSEARASLWLALLRSGD